MKWSEIEKNILKEKYPTAESIELLSREIKRSTRAISHEAARLGLSRGRQPSNKPKEKNYRKETDKKYYEENKKIIYTNKVKRLKRKKEKLLGILGGKCSKCGYSRCTAALEFHHTGNKEGHVAHILKNSSEEKALKEVKGCILLCANCHREWHNGGIV